MVLAVRSPDARQLTGVELMAHLYRCAGFGATRDQLESAIARGYEAAVEDLLHSELRSTRAENWTLWQLWTTNR